jgi:hypothetical protein
MLSLSFFPSRFLAVGGSYFAEFMQCIYIHYTCNYQYVPYLSSSYIFFAIIAYYSLIIAIYSLIFAKYSLSQKN